MVIRLTQAAYRWNFQSPIRDIDSKSVIKFTLFNLLTVCLATSGWLASGSAAWGEGVERQINVEEAQHLIGVKQGNHLPQVLTPAQQGSIANILLGVGYLLPCGICLGIFVYDKYCAYRVTVLNKQIESLEKVWEQSIQQ